MDLNRLIILYDVNRERYENGFISQETLLEFCEMALEMLLVENRDVLKRLKNE